MTKPHIDITNRLPTQTMRVINKCLDLPEDSQEVKFLMIYAIKDNELTKFLLDPEYATTIKFSERDRDEKGVIIQDVDCESVLKVQISGKAFACPVNNPYSGDPPPSIAVRAERPESCIMVHIRQRIISNTQ